MLGKAGVRGGAGSVVGDESMGGVRGEKDKERRREREMNERGAGVKSANNGGFTLEQAGPPQATVAGEVDAGVE